MLIIIIKQLTLADTEDFTVDIWEVTESRVQEWRRGQVPIIRDYDYKVYSCYCFMILIRFVLKIKFLATHGPNNEGFVGVDELEIFSSDANISCNVEPPEADLNNPTTTTTSMFRRAFNKTILNLMQELHK